MEFDVTKPPEVEYDDADLCLRWVSDDRSVAFSVTIMDGAVIGGISRLPPESGPQFWKVELPAKLVVVDPKLAGLSLAE